MSALWSQANYLYRTEHRSLHVLQSQKIYVLHSSVQIHMSLEQNDSKDRIQFWSPKASYEDLFSTSNIALSEGTDLSFELQNQDRIIMVIIKKHKRIAIQILYIHCVFIIVLCTVRQKISALLMRTKSVLSLLSFCSNDMYLYSCTLSSLIGTICVRKNTIVYLLRHLD